MKTTTSAGRVVIKNADRGRTHWHVGPGWFKVTLAYFWSRWCEPVFGFEAKLNTGTVLRAVLEGSVEML
jgi:hypothetical protein